MAPKSKVKIGKRTKYVKLATCIAISSCFIFYLYDKSYRILLESQKRDNEGWWTPKIFKLSEDTNQSYMYMLTEKQFYWLLLNSIKDDILNVFASFTRLWELFSIDLYVFSDTKSTVVFVITLVVVVTSGVWFYYCGSKSNKGNKKQKSARKKQESEKNSSQNTVSRSRNYDNGNLKYELEGHGDGHGVPYHIGKKRLWQWMTGLVFFGFMLSIPWEFMHLYQSMVAEKVVQMKAGIPIECIPEQMSFTQSLKSYLRWQFSWSSDPCLQYHKALLVDPLWQVPPLMVITSAFSHCVVFPFEVLLGGLGRGLRLFFREIPAPWQPIMLVVLVIFTLLITTMCMGYRIHLPFILKLEPKTPVYVQKRRKKVIETNGEKKCLDYSVESVED